MKNAAFYLVISGAALYCLLAFSDSHTPGISHSPRQAADCPAPASSPIVAIPFSPPVFHPAAVKIRKNIYSLSDAEITSIRKGIEEMKKLPLTDPTSWQYQAAIHYTTLTQNLPSWNSCQHGTNFFFSWHRMYLYFFEKILREKSHDPNLTLPYWDYQTNPVLHPCYRDAAASNPLYDGTRNHSINSGGALPNGPMVSIAHILANDIPYFTFNNDIQGPHGSIHVAIGGHMASVPTAALDPCFWLHHANIDRLWEEWLQLCDGRDDPTTDGAWMNQEYTFFDEHGKAVKMTGKQVVNTAASLDYKYDLPARPPCDKRVIPWRNWHWNRIEVLKLPAATAINQPKAKVSFQTAAVDALHSFTAGKTNAPFAVSRTTITDNLVIELADIKINKQPEGVVEVYLNLPAGQEPDPNSKSFVGVLDLFSVDAQHTHSMPAMPIELNATSTAERLGLGAADLSKAELTFFVRGNGATNNEALQKADLSIGKISFVVEQAVK